MNELILNIGLKVGDVQPFEQLELTTNEVKNVFPKCELQVKESTGDWGTENTAVFKIELDKYVHLENIMIVANYLCVRRNVLLDRHLTTKQMLESF